MNESVVFFYFQYVLVNWIYKSWVVLLEQINVVRHQIFVAQNSHKSSLFLCDLVIHWCAVSISICRRARTARLPFQRQARAVSFSPTNYKECLHRSEWVTHLHIAVPKTNFVWTLRVYHSFENDFLKLCQNIHVGQGELFLKIQVSGLIYCWFFSILCSPAA